ncbi:MAG: hypothetical protein ACFFCS_08375 [Candidatus Hodarchaeota archaeon]
MNLNRSEDTIIALDFEPKNVKMKQIKTVLKQFFHKKTAADSSDRYNLVLFRGNPSYLEDFTFKTDYILSLIDEELASANTVPVESCIFMALTFIIEVYKNVGNKFFRIIIITDQDMKPVMTEFMVKDLLAITKEMPVYIDILRLNVKEEKDENKDKLATIINWSKGGELIYLPKIKKLEEEMLHLADKKYNEEDDVFEEVKEIKIPDEHSSFYEEISKDPKMLEDKSLQCMACFKPGLMYECPHCNNVKMHEDCWAHWSSSSNIGVRNVFRCPICFGLLKLPRGFIEEILGEEHEHAEETVQNIVVADQDEILKEKDKEAPKLIEALLDTLG